MDNGSAARQDEMTDCVVTESTQHAKNQPTIVHPAVDDSQSSQNTGWRCRKRGRRDYDAMDYTSKSQASGRKKPSVVATKDGAILCHSLALSDDKLEKMSQTDVAREITRCLQEPKFNVVNDVVRVFGIPRALEVFHQTAAIQESGGQPTADGDGEKKKSPGGVYFALVKSVASSDERREIFRADKLQKERRKKTIKKKRGRAKQLELTKQKADWQLKVFRTQLENPLDSEWDIAHKVSLECDTTYTQLERRPKNIHKRLGRKLQANIRTDDSAELMEVESTHTTGEESAIDNSLPSDSLEESERQAAEQFELTTECNMDFDLDIT